MDGGYEGKESQHGTLPEAGLGLEGLSQLTPLVKPQVKRTLLDENVTQSNSAERATRVGFKP